MKFNVVMETKDRRMIGHPNYLGQTLANLRRAGAFDSPYLNSFTLVSGGQLADFHHLEVWPQLVYLKTLDFVPCPATGRTRQQNAALAIREGARKPGADFVIKLEDDLDFCADFLGSASRWLSKRQHEAPLFTLAATFAHVSDSKFGAGERTIFDVGSSFPMIRQALKAGKDVAYIPPAGFWGAQAIAMPVTYAQQLADWLGDDPYFDDGKEQHRKRGHDLLIAKWLMQVGARHVPCAVPSFVQHWGFNSNLDEPTLGLKQPFFEFPFAGREWSYA